MSAILGILTSSILTQNVILNQFLGICPFLGVSKNRDSATGMGLAATFVLVLATAFTWPIYTYVLVPLGLKYMQTVVFILVIATLVQLVEIVLKAKIPSLYRSLGVYLPLITTNCAILGITTINIAVEYNFIESMVNAFGSGVGFLLALYIFAGVRSRIDDSNIPKMFRGVPATLIAAAIVALSFMGFSGISETLFG